MAKIGGVEIKGLTRFKGHDGEPLTQGNIYFTGKKIGSYSEDSWGGCMDIDIERSYLEEFREVVLSYYKGNMDTTNEEYFIYELIELLEREKDYKKACKKGYGVLVVIELDYGVFSHVNMGYNKSDEDIMVWINNHDELKEYAKNNENFKVDIYRGLEDFII